MNAYDIPSDEDEVDENNRDDEKRTFSRKVNQPSCITAQKQSIKSPIKNPWNPKVGYVFSPKLLMLCDKMVQVRGRARLVHSLIASYKLLESLRVEILPPVLASYEDLVSFHDSTFVNYLREMNSAIDDEDDLDEEGEDFGLMYDCPPVKRIYEFVLRTVGASLTAARSLTSGRCGVAINWFGGWHHAQRDRAAGFCYANDVVISIQELKKKLGKVLYVDLDLHHGDGVQEAFRHTDSVFTVSFHKHETGFFPGTGALEEVGLGKGAGCCVNVPLKDGIADEKYRSVFARVMFIVLKRFRPSAVVIQCGADGLFGDPHQSFNLTSNAVVECVRYLMDHCPVPTLLLGGGGYNHVNTAKCWTSVLGAVLDEDIPDDIPDSCSQFEQFGPDFTINVTPGYVEDKNSEDYLDSLVCFISKQCSVNGFDESVS